MKKETIQVGQVKIDFLLESADTNGSAAMFEFTVPVGAKMPSPTTTNIMMKPFMGCQV